MNKFLLASTALVASTTFAMADVSLSGMAEMGVFGVNSDLDANDRDLQFHTDIDVTFSMAGETDSGLTFGASIDLDESDGSGNCSIVTDPATGFARVVGGGACAIRGNSPAFDPQSEGGETIFVDSAFGRLTMGDTDGALDWALQEAIIGGSIADDHEHAGYNNNNALDGSYDNQVARYEYAFGDFAVAGSAEIDDAGNGDPVLGLGARYSGDLGGLTFGAGLGYQTFSDDSTGRDADALGLSLSAKMQNGLQAVVNYSQYDRDFTAAGVTTSNDIEHVGIAVGYEFGEFLVAANYGQFSNNDVVTGEGYGLVANYDLGGGASLQAGYGNSNLNEDLGGVDFETYSFGIAMSF